MGRTNIVTRFVRAVTWVLKPERLTDQFPLPPHASGVKRQTFLHWLFASETLPQVQHVDAPARLGFVRNLFARERLPLADCADASKARTGAVSRGKKGN
ncbi:MAG: hypothetical protein HZB26_14670 [Candidatus Hydrogenedentes bacterium]|nr:hypothetical protein [Candidatus Hydrogenedentota bacterium]